MFQRHLLPEADVEPLARGVVRTLETVGILCQYEELLGALDAAGARVDFASQRVRFPRAMQGEFVGQFHREAAGRRDDGHREFDDPGLPTLNGQVAQFALDDATGERRRGNRADFLRLVRLGEVLHPDAAVGHCLLLTDVPPLVEPLEAALLLAEHASRPAAAFAWNVRQVDYLVEMGEILGLGDWYSLGAMCFSHPLRFDRDVADRFVLRARQGGPIGLTAMPVAGMTTPVTLEGFVVVASAEMLAGWIAARALNPQARLGGSMWGGTLDMKTGAVSYCSFDAMLYSFATVEFLRRWCGVVVPVGGGEYCDAREPGLYAALEKAYKAMTIAAFTGRHPGLGQGMLENGKTLSPVQLLIERDLAGGIRNYARTAEPTPEAIALETIEEVGLGLTTNYLQAEHTLRHFRQSLWLPGLLDRSGWRGPEHEAAILASARERVNDLVAAYRKPEVDPDTLARLRQVVARARKELLR